MWATCGSTAWPGTPSRGRLGTCRNMPYYTRQPTFSSGPGDAEYDDELWISQAIYVAASSASPISSRRARTPRDVGGSQ